MRCKVCDSPRLTEIHAALDAGGGVNATAAAFQISATTLKRHHPAHRQGGQSDGGLDDLLLAGARDLLAAAQGKAPAERVGYVTGAALAVLAAGRGGSATR